MKVQHRSKICRSLTPEGLKRLLSWPNQKAQVLDVIRQIPHIEEFFGPERRIVETVRIPETWTELREALRDLTPARNYGIGLIYYRKCRYCGSRFEAIAPRRKYCPDKDCKYKHRLQKGYFKKEMASKRKKARRINESYIAEQERIRKQQMRREAEKLYREVTFGNLDKKEKWRYNEILCCLGGGDAVKGHKKIVAWYERKLKFEQIPESEVAPLKTIRLPRSS